MLNDLHNVARGTLSASGNNGGGVLDTVSTASRSQDWSLDALGNWSSLTNDGTAQSRTHNSQNQITSIQTQTTPTYDSNGDTTTDNAGQQYTFDAWNHIHAVKNAGGTTLVTYSYDATYRRIQEAPASGATSDLFYSASWQVLEERLSTHASTAYAQYAWSPVYVDAMILRDRDTNADGTLDERLYCLQDANFNVTSTLSTAGAIQERYRYDPYGAATFLDSSFNIHASAYAWQYLHQGGRLDLVSGLYCFRNRDLHTALGRWMQQDPLGNVDGMNRYCGLTSSPLVTLDSYGLAGYSSVAPTFDMFPPFPQQISSQANLSNAWIKNMLKTTYFQAWPVWFPVDIVPFIESHDTVAQAGAFGGYHVTARLQCGICDYTGTKVVFQAATRYIKKAVGAPLILQTTGAPDIELEPASSDIDEILFHEHLHTDGVQPLRASFPQYNLAFHRGFNVAMGIVGQAIDSALDSKIQGANPHDCEIKAAKVILDVIHDWQSGIKEAGGLHNSNMVYMNELGVHEDMLYQNGGLVP